jgi:type IV pilus assembly protein PilQ
LYNGQTTVIGGLSKENKAQSEAGVPGLRDVPLLGWLFGGSANEAQLEDLLIFITPHILEKRPAELGEPKPSHNETPPEAQQKP